MEDSKNLKICIVALTTLLTCGIALLIYFYRRRQQKKIKNRILKTIRSVNLKAYNRQDRAELKDILNRYARKAKAATSKVDLYAIRSSLENTLDNFRASAARVAGSANNRISDIHIFSK